MLADFKFAFRQLTKAPGFTAVAVLTLTLGLSVNSMFFSVTNDLFFRPLPAKNPNELVIIAQKSSAFGYQVPVSYADAQDLRSMLDHKPGTPDMARAFVDLMAFKEDVVNFASTGRTAERAWVHFGTDNYFSLLGVQPHRGRFFLPNEAATPGSEAVIVLTYDTWHNRFKEDDSIVGQAVKLNGIPFTVIGVAPAGFFGASWGVALTGFVPVTMATRLIHNGVLNRGNTCTFLMGRLQPGVGLKQAQAAADVAFARLVSDHPGYYPPGPGVVVMRESNSRPSPYVAHQTPKIVLALTLLALLVLAVAIANVSSLLYARAASRERELAIRAAVGASRFQIIRGLIAESILLALAAGFGGAVTSLWLEPLLIKTAPGVGAPAAELVADWRPFVITGLAALVVGVITGLLPAVKASGIAPLGFLKETPAAGRQRHPLRSLLVVGQVALSCVVLVCAALALRSLVLLTSIPTGFRTDNLILASYDLNLQNYTVDQGRRFHEQLLEKVRVLPGVESASITTGLPVSPRLNQLGGIRAEGEPSSVANERPLVSYVIADNDYLSTLGLRLEKGRPFDSRDRFGSARVVVINQALARQLFGDKEPVGQRMAIQGDHNVEVIGVLAPSRYCSLSDDSRPLLIDVLAQNYRGTATLVVRSAESSTSVIDAITKTVRQLDPALPLFETGTLRQHISDSPAGLMPYRLGAILAGSQGLVALLLAGAGIFGLIAFTVAQRTREIGIRMALGASRMQVIRTVAKESITLTLAGVVFGLACSFAIVRLLSGLLYGTGKFEIVIFCGVALLLLSAAALACWLPARRAVRINPIEALRAD